MCAITDAGEQSKKKIRITNSPVLMTEWSVWLTKKLVFVMISVRLVLQDENWSCECVFFVGVFLFVFSILETLSMANFAWVDGSSLKIYAQQSSVPFLVQFVKNGE